MRSLKHFAWVPVVTAVAFAYGCASSSNRLTISIAPPDVPCAILRLENQIDPVSLWKPAIQISVWVDDDQSFFLLPLGVTEVRLADGLHEIIHHGVNSSGSAFFSKPLVIATLLEAGKTYTLRFRFTGNILQGEYTVDYEGWPEGVTEKWPKQHPTTRHSGQEGISNYAAARRSGEHVSTFDPSRPARTDFVAIIRSRKAYTIFQGFPASRLDDMKAFYAGKADVEIVTWDAFRDNADQQVKFQVLTNEYPAVRLTEGIVALLQKYPERLFAVTWNGGIAYKRWDHRAAEKTYKLYSEDRAAYNLFLPRDPAHDPLNPMGHFRPLLGW